MTIGESVPYWIMKEIQERDMTEGQRCEKHLPIIREALDFIFKQKISAEMEFLDEYTIIINGHIELVPIVAVPPTKVIKRFGKEHVISYKEERPIWQINLITYIPQTRWEPEDADINEHGTYESFRDAMQEIFRLISNNLYSNLQESKDYSSNDDDLFDKE